MKTRDFLKSLLGTAVAFVVPTAVVADVVETLPVAMQVQAEIDYALICEACVSKGVNSPSAKQMLYKIVPKSSNTSKIDWLYLDNPRDVNGYHRLAYSAGDVVSKPGTVHAGFQSKSTMGRVLKTDQGAISILNNPVRQFGYDKLTKR